MFFDIVGAFDDTSFGNMVSAARRFGVNNTTTRWLSAMLHGRRDQATMFGETLRVSVVRGYSQVGVLFQGLWNLVIDDRLDKLNAKGYYTRMMT